MIKIAALPLLLFLFVGFTYAQVADSLYDLGFKFYNSNDKESAKKCLIALIERPMNSKDSDQRYSVLGYGYYVNSSYDLLKRIYYEEGDYADALFYNEKQYKFNYVRDIFEMEIYRTARDSFSAECYYAMKDYKNAMEVSSRYIFSDRMSFIFVNSTENRFGKQAFREEFIEEFEKIPEWTIEYDSSDKKNVKKKINGPRPVTFNIFGYELQIYLLKEAKQIEDDLNDNKTTLTTANNRFKDEIKKQPIYKLIMEN